MYEIDVIKWKFLGTCTKVPGSSMLPIATVKDSRALMGLSAA